MKHQKLILPSSACIDIQALQKYYQGFYVPPSSQLILDNQKAHQSLPALYVPPLIFDDRIHLEVGSEPAYFSQEGGHISIYNGLRNFLYTRINGKDVFIFDNHHHAFFFWIAAYQSGVISPGEWLVHIDLHSDMWPPATWPDFSLDSPKLLERSFHYTNYHLNIATFIKPALQLGLFSEVEFLNGYYPSSLQPPKGYVLDIDMDIFSNDFPDSPTYLMKISRFREYIHHAGLITIATSPGFM
ncbi:MAG: hypothetical protein D6748_11175, partial [Calditrichaeota bacterium]